jgi:hypothetical protein
VRTSSSQARMAGMVGGSPRGVQAEPTHILADRAELEHATEIATFYGRPARLWQGGNQVQAPVIEFSKSQKRLVARGDATTGSTAVQVHTVLAAAGIDGSAATGVRKPGTGVGGCDAKATAKSGSSATGTDSRTPGADVLGPVAPSGFYGWLCSRHDRRDDSCCGWYGLSPKGCGNCRCRCYVQ